MSKTIELPGVTTDPGIGSPREDVDDAVKNAFAKRWVLLLWNDDHNPMDYVVMCIIEILAMDVEKAIKLMASAHKTGKVGVAMDHREKLELYHEQFGEKGLTTTIESLD